MVTLGDIAREAGVSIGTVERALKNKGRIAEKTKQRILETAERMGYKPNLVAQGLAVRKKNIRIAFFYVNDSFAPLQKRIAEIGKRHHIPIVTGDLATPAQKDLLARRSCAAEIAQDVAEQGNKTMETLFNYLAYGTEPETKWIRTGVNVNLPESV